MAVDTISSLFVAQPFSGSNLANAMFEVAGDLGAGNVSGAVTFSVLKTAILSGVIPPYQFDLEGTGGAAPSGAGKFTTDASNTAAITLIRFGNGSISGSGIGSMLTVGAGNYIVLTDETNVAYQFKIVSVSANDYTVQSSLTGGSLTGRYSISFQPGVSGLAGMLSISADGNSVDQTNLGALTLAVNKDVTVSGTGRIAMVGGASAPATQAMGTPDVYGGATSVLGTPTGWVNLKIDGVDRAVAYY